MKIANFKGELGLFRISFTQRNTIAALLGQKQNIAMVPSGRYSHWRPAHIKGSRRGICAFIFPAGTASTTSPTEAPQVSTRPNLLLSSCPIKFSLGFKTPHSTKINCCLFWDLSFFNESYRKPFSQFKQVLRASPPIEVDRRISCFRWGRRKEGIAT